jgi:hypothetical protein
VGSWLRSSMTRAHPTLHPCTAEVRELPAMV